MKQKRRTKRLLAHALLLASVLGLAWASRITSVSVAGSELEATPTLLPQRSAELQTAAAIDRPLQRYLARASVRTCDSTIEGIEHSARSFRVDTTPPTGSILINGGDSTTNKITVHLDITGDDGPVGCGVTEMRLSNDGFNWEAWEPFATEGEWLLPTLNRTTWMVHLQLKDLVGNVSESFTDDIYLDLYPPRPSSESYQLGARVVASGDPTSTSESYGLLSATMGQPIADGRMQGTAYRLESGYQGTWPSVPRGRPAAESYDINPSVMASSGGSQQSESYQLRGTSGQPADHNQPSSENYQLLSGFWGKKSAPPVAVTLSSFIARSGVLVPADLISRSRLALIAVAGLITLMGVGALLARNL